METTKNLQKLFSEKYDDVVLYNDYYLEINNRIGVQIYTNGNLKIFDVLSYGNATELDNLEIIFKIIDNKLEFISHDAYTYLVRRELIDKFRSEGLDFDFLYDAFVIGNNIVLNVDYESETFTYDVLKISLVPGLHTFGIVTSESYTFDFDNINDLIEEIQYENKHNA